MIRIGKGLALKELAKRVEENFPTPPGDEDLYIFGLADIDRQSHFYLGGIPHTEKIKKAIEAQGFGRVHTELPVTVAQPNAVGIVASMRTEEMLPVTANILTFIYAAMNDKVKFPRERVTQFTPQPRDIFAIVDYIENVHPHVVVTRRDQEGIQIRKLTGRRPWALTNSVGVLPRRNYYIPNVQVGDYVRCKVDQPRWGLTTEDLGVIREISNGGDTCYVDFPAGRIRGAVWEFALVLPPELPL